MPTPATRGPTLTLNSCRVSRMKKEITSTRAKLPMTAPRVLARRWASGLCSPMPVAMDRATALDTRRSAQRMIRQVAMTTSMRCSFCQPVWSSHRATLSRCPPTAMPMPSL